VTLGPGIPSVQAVSSGGNYATGLCYRHVTDIVVRRARPAARVAVGAKVGAAWKQVRASAFHVPIIT
jgi:hypothetical protein